MSTFKRSCVPARALLLCIRLLRIVALELHGHVKPSNALGVPAPPLLPGCAMGTICGASRASLVSTAPARLLCLRLLAAHLLPACPPPAPPPALQVDDGPCVMYIGGGGAGNFVKMVHNGIEYGDMQLISEVSRLGRGGAYVSGGRGWGTRHPHHWCLPVRGAARPP